MTPPTGKALEMRQALAQLCKRHNVQQPPARPLPLGDLWATPVIHEGWGTTCTTDQQRMQFAPYCFGRPLPSRMPPLHLRHDETRTVGTVDALAYDDDGQLLVACTVHDIRARAMPAFSVGATVLAYEIRNAASPANFHAYITAARLEEISLTNTPANLQAKIMFSYRVSPAVERYDLLTQKVAKLVQLVDFIKEQSNAALHER